MSTVHRRTTCAKAPGKGIWYRPKIKMNLIARAERAKRGASEMEPERRQGLGNESSYMKDNVGEFGLYLKNTG